MPSCHDCKRERGPYCWEKCHGPSETPDNHGQVIIDYDAVQSFEVAVSQCQEMENDGKYHDALIEFMRQWVRMPATTRDAVAYRISQPELSDAEIGRRIGISRAGVGIALRRCNVDVSDRREAHVDGDEDKGQIELTFGLKV